MTDSELPRRTPGARGAGRREPLPYSRIASGQPVPGLALGDAYRIQRLNVVRRVSTGGRVVGHKIGLASLAVQQQMGIHGPDSGFVFDDMISPSGSRLSVADCMTPRIETGVIFRIGRGLNAPRT